MIRTVLQTSLFARQKKRLHRNQITDLDSAVRAVLSNPVLGEEKSGDLKSVRVHKFRMAGQLVLLAYEFGVKNLTLLALGAQENFYRDLKTYRRS